MRAALCVCLVLAACKSKPAAPTASARPASAPAPVGDGSARAQRGLAPGGAPRLSPATRTLVPETVQAVPGTLAVSPDSRAVAFVVRRGERQAVVATGRELTGTYQSVDPGSLRFSDDGQHLAFAAIDGGATFVVRDGQPGASYQGIARTTLHWSPDGKRLGYAAAKAGQQVVVIDGEESARYDVVLEDTPSFDPTSTRVTWGGRRGATWFVAVDGHEGPGFRGVGGARFSPSGKHVVYLGDDGQARHLLVDGKAETPIGPLGEQGPLFGPDEAVAYAAQLDQGWGVVVGGHVIARAPQVFDLVFDESGKHLLYATGTATQQRVVFDGHEQPLYDQLGGVPRMSRDGTSFAYAARRGHDWFVVANGHERGPFPSVLGRPGLSPDGRHLGFFAGGVGGIMLHLDDWVGEPYQLSQVGTRALEFDAAGAVHYLGGKGYEVYLIDQPAP